MTSREENYPADPSGETTRRWLPPALIVLAALAAHGGCLGSTFYLDDWTQIVDNDGVDGGQWWGHHSRALTYFTYWLTYRGFGMSAPAFHAGNLLLHAGVALAVYGFAKEFLAAAVGLPPDRARRISAWAGGLFAVHPLCSEIPNYVRARDIALVTLFAVLTAWAVLRWRRRGGWWPLAAALAAILAATFSKEVGVVVASGTAVLTWFGVPRPERGPPERRRHRRPVYPVPVVLTLIAIPALMAVIWLQVSIYNFLWPVGHAAWEALHHPRLGWHLLTESRVFWLYGWRVFLPIRLCSDHQIAWTISLADGPALLAAASLAAVLAGTAFLWFRARTRPLALLLTLAWLAILHRLGNVSSELMVEYRMYPAMTFLCIALVWGLDRLLTHPKLVAMRPTVLTLLLAVGVVLSGWRTRDWRNVETLSANVVAQYPLQARARQEVQEADVRAGRWPSVLARQVGIRRALDDMQAFNRSQPLRRYDPGLAALTRVSSEGNYAVALAHTRSEWAAFDHLTWLTQRVRENQLDDPIYQSSIHLARGTIYEFVGPEEAAVRELRESRDIAPYFNVPQRELQRIEARQKK